MNTQHTPTPWRAAGALRGRGIHTRIVDAKGYEVAVANEPERAAFIVLACNSHDALLEAAKALVDWAETVYLSKDNEAEAVELIIKLRAAIAAATPVEGRTA